MEDYKVTLSFDTLVEAIYFHHGEFIRNKGYEPEYLVMNKLSESRLSFEQRMLINGLAPLHLLSFIGMYIVIIDNDKNDLYFEIGSNPK